MPFVASVSAREPASIQTPTVAVCAWGCDSVATVKPFERVVISVVGVDGKTVAKLRRGERFGEDLSCQRLSTEFFSESCVHGYALQLSERREQMKQASSRTSS